MVVFFEIVVASAFVASAIRAGAGLLLVSKTLPELSALVMDGRTFNSSSLKVVGRSLGS